MAHLTKRIALFVASLTIVATLGFSAEAQEKEPAQKKEPAPKSKITLLKPGLFKSITNPPCSYCVVQHRKGFIKQQDGRLRGSAAVTTGERFRCDTSWPHLA